MELNHDKSKQLFQEAKKCIPGGVNSPVRAFKAVGEYPLFIDHGMGSRLVDVDGNIYIDYIGSWGPLILGHRHPKVINAMNNCIRKGVSFGAPTEVETKVAEIMCRAIPSVEMVRMVNSGTEATMSALRLARAYTKRDKILKFTGCYHGHSDSFLIKADSGALTFGVPSSPGVPKETAGTTLSAAFNNLQEVKDIFAQVGEEIAAVIVEPVAGNMGVVPPKPEFLAGLRDITKQYGALLILDEVMTGFRVAWGGAQCHFNIEPDLTCLGKIIGGGLPVGAYGGKREIMELISPRGSVYQARTLSGNPLAMSAGLATLKEAYQPGTYEILKRLTNRLAQGIEEAAQRAGIPVKVNHAGSMISCFFTEQEVVDFESAVTSDTEKYKVFFQSMLDQGVYLAPSQFEAMFISLAHTEEDIEYTLDACNKALQAL